MSMITGAPSDRGRPPLGALDGVDRGSAQEVQFPARPVVAEARATAPERVMTISRPGGMPHPAPERRPGPATRLPGGSSGRLALSRAGLQPGLSRRVARASCADRPARASVKKAPATAARRWGRRSSRCNPQIAPLHAGPCAADILAATPWQKPLPRPTTRRLHAHGRSVLERQHSKASSASTTTFLGSPARTRRQVPLNQIPTNASVIEPHTSLQGARPSLTKNEATWSLQGNSGTSFAAATRSSVRKL